MLRVKDICKEQGITIAILAKRVGVLPPALSRIINGGNTTTDTLRKIADALNVPVTELFEQPASDTITCPKCGAKLEIKAKE